MSQIISNRTSSDHAALQGNDIEELEGHGETGHEQGRPPRRRQWLAPDSYLATYVGIASVLIGFVLIAVAWGSVAGEANVSRQIPYLVSAGFTGLSLIMCGLVVINIAAKRQDAAERARQFTQLTEVLRELRSGLDGSDRP